MSFWEKAQENFTTYLDSGDLFIWTERLVYVALVILAAYIFLIIARRLITHLFEITRLDEHKAQTLASLLNSTIRYVVYAGAILIILEVLKVPIAPLLAGAGIAGLAIGFGAQSLVKDIITGFFVIFEDQFHVGDFVEINGQVSGTIEELGFRMTTIREWSGKKFYVANSEIKTVRNYNRQKLRAIVTATFPFNENPQRVRQVLELVCREITDAYRDHLICEDGQIVEPPQIYGVTDIDKNDRGAQYTLIALTKPESIWTMEKVMRECIWQKCIETGVRLAYPRRIYESNREFGPMLSGDTLKETANKPV